MSIAIPRRHLALRIPADALVEIDRLAEEHGLTRTAYMVRASTGELTDPLDLDAALEEIERRISRLEQFAYGN